MIYLVLSLLKKIVVYGGKETDLPTDKYGFYGIYGNEFGVNCGNMVFLASSYSNKFGNNCYSNTFGVFTHTNTFGNYCTDNSFGADMQSNVFGNFIQGNIALKRFRSNSCLTELYDCQFGNDIKYNSFGVRDSDLDLWDGCQYNSFGNFNRNILLHGTCYSNKFGNDCYDITCTNSCNGNNFENDVNSTIYDNIKNKLLHKEQTFDYPSSSGTFALTSDLNAYASNPPKLNGISLSSGANVNIDLDRLNETNIILHRITFKARESIGSGLLAYRVWTIEIDYFDNDNTAFSKTTFFSVSKDTEYISRAISLTDSDGTNISNVYLLKTIIQSTTDSNIAPQVRLIYATIDNGNVTLSSYDCVNTISDFNDNVLTTSLASIQVTSA